MRKHLIPVSFETHELVSEYAEMAGFYEQNGIYKTSKRVWINQPKRIYHLILESRRELNVPMDLLVRICIKSYIRVTKSTM